MNTNPTLQDRAVKAAARFLEVRGYETLNLNLPRFR